MDIYIAQSFPHNIVGFNESKYLFMLYQKSHWQSLQKRDDARSVLEVSASELTYDERMTHGLPVDEQFHQAVMGLSEMGYPDRCINKNHLDTPPPRYLLQLLLGAPQFGQSLSAFSRYERLQSKLYQCGLFLYTRHFGCLINQAVFDIERGSHRVTSLKYMHKYANIMHTCQAVFR